jgi:hypothetical protein
MKFDDDVNVLILMMIFKIEKSRNMFFGRSPVIPILTIPPYETEKRSTESLRCGIEILCDYS